MLRLGDACVVVPGSTSGCMLPRLTKKRKGQQMRQLQAGNASILVYDTERSMGTEACNRIVEYMHAARDSGKTPVLCP